MQDLQIIQNKIYEIRGQRVMLDRDLAELYQVPTKALKQAIRRNSERFEGDDFMFELSTIEYNSLKDRLRSQFVTLENDGRGRFPKYAPFAFTEQGVAMLSSVLNNATAIQINRGIIRAFVQMRNYLTAQQTIPAELAELRSRLLLVERDSRDNLEAMNDLSEDLRKDIDAIYEAIGALSVKLPEAKKLRQQKIGFHRCEESTVVITSPNITSR